MEERQLPLMGPKNVCQSPHVLILGAGASVAACPNGDKQERQLPELKGVVEACGLHDLLEQNGILGPYEDFESLYDSLKTGGKHEELCTKLEERVREYFAEVQIPEEVTVYDQILLALREKDVIATFNWDPLLGQAYRRNVSVRRLPELLFLHGNVEVGICYKCKGKGWTYQVCKRCGSPLTPSPLLFPVHNKDYTADPFLAAEWRRLQNMLSTAYYLTIFGYSAPVTDAAAVGLLKSAWASNATLEFAQVDIIDVKGREEIKETWDPFIVREHYGVQKIVERNWLLKHPRRSCDALAAATLMNMPWPNNQMPKTTVLEDLQSWLRPLLVEEDALENKDEGFSGQPCVPIKR